MKKNLIATLDIYGIGCGLLFGTLLLSSQFVGGCSPYLDHERLLDFRDDYGVVEGPNLGENRGDRSGNHTTDGVRTTLVKADVARLLQDTGFPVSEIPKMVCTAKFESNFRSLAINNNRNGTQDTGIFQINDIWLAQCNLTREELLNPTKNVKCAHHVYQKQGLKAWTAYNRRKSDCKKYKLEPAIAMMIKQGEAINHEIHTF